MAVATADDPRRFLDPKVISRIQRLHVRARNVVEGFIAGWHRSPTFGHSVEFTQHREYTPGDDPRHLDWKVWSRTDRYVVKQFEAETNLRCTLVVDASESMQYGSGPMTKYDYAATVAASLAYLLLRQQDAVGLITFDQTTRQIVPARSQQKHLDALLQALDVSQPRAKTDLDVILKRVTEAEPARGMVVIISDLLAPREPFFRGLDLLCQRRHDLLVFHVLDPAELEFPFAGTTKFEGMEELPELVCDPRALRDGYLEALNEYLTEVRRGCARRGVEYALVRTTDYLDAVLTRFLTARMTRR
ncbi:MAG TPA: DUF58 domain-containing protein [Gemmatales bacterium]|nr:DUF58 domain-containing protein [Gemmatales bacterium]HMP59255.1 DUF58 domain-containing protein [Gemmatales bacterium]